MTELDAVREERLKERPKERLEEAMEDYIRHPKKTTHPHPPQIPRSLPLPGTKPGAAATGEHDAAHAAYKEEMWKQQERYLEEHRAELRNFRENWEKCGNGRRDLAATVLSSLEPTSNVLQAVVPSHLSISPPSIEQPSSAPSTPSPPLPDPRPAYSGTPLTLSHLARIDRRMLLRRFQTPRYPSDQASACPFLLVFLLDLITS